MLVNESAHLANELLHVQICGLQPFLQVLVLSLQHGQRLFQDLRLLENTRDTLLVFDCVCSVFVYK